MNKSHKIAGLAMIAAAMLIATAALAQWPNDDYTNLLISDQSGAQVIPHVAATSNGGCYISWYSNASGNYDMYLQLLDGNGIPQWQANGLLISSHPQDTWLTDYSIAVDQQDNAIIAFNDIRAGSDWDIYGYRISPSGEFLWGPNGLTISNNSSYEYDPQVMVTSAGNIVFAWQNEDTVCVRKVSPTGQDLWIPATIIYSAEFGLSIPRVTASDNDAIILQYLMKLGQEYWRPKFLYVRKLNASGGTVWPADTVAVSTADGFGPQMQPEIKSDGAGGAYSFWYDSRGGLQFHAYAQHITANGTVAWNPDGVLLSSTGAEMQGPPALTLLPGTSDVLTFFPTCDLDQNHDGLKAQRIDVSGNRLWGDDGVTLIPLADLSLDAVMANPQTNGAIVTYYQSPNDVSNCLIRAIRVDSTGAQVWPESPTMMSSAPSSKGHYISTANSLGQVIEVWEDDRNGGDGDLYLQNINPDGSLGGSTAINEQAMTIPSIYNLEQNYPNPFNATTMIKYDLPKASQVTIAIYDLLGRKVTTLVDGIQQTGHHEITWNAGDFASGVYLYKLTADGFTKTQKMQLLK